MSTKNGGGQPSTSEGDQLPSNSRAQGWRARLKPHLTSQFLVKLATIAALILSIIQLYQAEKTRRESDIRAEEAQVAAKKIAGQYEELAKSVSTRYVGVFPKNMKDIIELLEKTRYSLTIITDVAAYGHFSSPRSSDDYVNLLKALSFTDRDIKIKFLCYNWEEAKSKLISQFGDFAKLKASPEYKNYVRLHANEPQNIGQLVEQINDAGKVLLRALKDHKAEIHVTTGKNELPIFMWIRDGEEAIFSLHNYGQSPREDSFRTSDPNFIRRLREIADEDIVKSQIY